MNLSSFSNLSKKTSIDEEWKQFLQNESINSFSTNLLNYSKQNVEEYQNSVPQKDKIKVKEQLPSHAKEIGSSSTLLSEDFPSQSTENKSFSTLHTVKSLNFDSTSFSQKSFSPTLISEESLKLTFLAEASPKPKINFSKCNVEKLSSQATANWCSSTLSSEESLTTFIENDCYDIAFSQEQIVNGNKILEKEVNIFGGGIAGAKNEFFEMQCKKNETNSSEESLSLSCQAFIPVVSICETIKDKVNSFSPTLRFGKNDKHLNKKKVQCLPQYFRLIKKQDLMNFSTLQPEKLIFGSGNASAKNVNFDSTSFPQNSFSPTLRSGENVNSPTLRTEESLNLPPKCDDLYISTKTKVLYFNQPIDIQNVFWKIPIIEYWKPEEGVIKKQIKIVCKTPEETEEYKNKIKNISYYREHIIKQVNNPTARVLKYKDERKITVGLNKKDIINLRCKIKNAFYNCFVIIIRFKHEGLFREIHVKVFNTGKMEIPGVFNKEHLQIVKSKLLTIIEPLLTKNVVPINLSERRLDEDHLRDSTEQSVEEYQFTVLCEGKLSVSFEEKGNVEKLKITEPIKDENVLINSNFNCGYYIDRERLYNILTSKYGIECSFDPCSYPGVKCKYYFNNENSFDEKEQTGQISNEDRKMKMSDLGDYKKYTEVSFMVFRTGSCLIVGNCSEKILRFIFQFLKNVLYTEYYHIYIANEFSTIKEKKFKQKKKKIVVTALYLEQLTF